MRIMHSVTSAVLVSVAVSASAAGQTGPSYLDKIEVTRSKALPDGMPLADDESLVAFKGVPTGSRLIWNGSDFGQFRRARLTQIKDPRQFIYQFQIIRPDGSSLARTINVGPKEYIEVSLNRVLAKKVVITRLDCIRHDGPVFDRPRLIYRADNSQTSNAVQQNRMVSGDSWAVGLPIVMEQEASIELWDMDRLSTPDHLGTIRIDVESKDRRGEFNFDPNRKGVLYKVAWRIEPDDTLSEAMARQLRDLDTRQKFDQTLVDRVDNARALKEHQKRAADHAKDEAEQAEIAARKAREEYAKAKQDAEDRKREADALQAQAAADAVTAPAKRAALEAEKRNKKSDLDRLGDELNNAKVAVADILRTLFGDLEAAKRTRDRLQGRVDALKDEIAKIDQALVDLDKSRLDAIHAVEKFNFAKALEDGKKSTQDVAERVQVTVSQGYEQAKDGVENAVKTVQTALEIFTAKDIIVYRIENEMAFSLNVYTGAYDAKLDLGFAGVEMDTEDIKNLFRGQFKAPSVNPIKLIAASFGQKLSESSDYTVSRDSALGATDSHVYVASERFVRWGGPETAARLIGASIFDGGNQARQEARQELLLEFDRIYSWVALRAKADAPRLSRELFAAALSKGSVSVPEFTIRPLTVPYEYRIEVMGEVPLPDAIKDILRSRLGSLIPGVTGGNFNLDHYGYAIEWKPKESDAHQKLLDRLESEMFQGTSGASAAMQDAMREAVSRLGGSDLGKLASLVTAADFAAVQIENDIKSRIESQLAINKDDLAKWYVPGSPLIKLEGTPLGLRFKEFFSGIAMGNKGRAELVNLEFNLETFTFTGKAKVIHEHSWGSLSDLLSKF